MPENEVLRYGFRELIWPDLAILAISDSPVFGQGILATSASTMGIRSFEHAHNVFLASLFHGGLVGFVLLISLFGACMLCASRMREHIDSLLCLSLVVYAAVTFLIDGDVPLNSVDHFWVIFWWPVALVASRWSVRT